MTHKYRAKPETVDGIRFASRKEARRYRELKLLEQAGEITHLELQPVYRFPINGEYLRALPTKRGRGREITYIADFRYRTPQGRVVEDVKGMDTPVSRLKRALMLHIHGIDVKII